MVGAVSDVNVVLHVLQDGLVQRQEVRRLPTSFPPPAHDVDIMFTNTVRSRYVAVADVHAIGATKSKERCMHPSNLAAARGTGTSMFGFTHHRKRCRKTYTEPTAKSTTNEPHPHPTQRYQHLKAQLVLHHDNKNPMRHEYPNKIIIR